jgi:predicted nucleic acid-binding protein
MKYILDTDTLIYFLKGETHVIKNMLQIESTAIHTSIISHSELLFGAYNSAHVERNLKKILRFLNSISILPYDENASTLFGKLKAKLKIQGNLIADMDLMIASICLSQKATLVTNNSRHFERIPRLKFINWAN